MSRGRLLVVSHPAVERVNQTPYAGLRELGWEPSLVVPARWRHTLSRRPFAPQPAPGLGEGFRPVRTALAGRQQRHFYLARTGRLVRQARPRIAFVEEEPFAVAALQWGRSLAREGIPFGVQADENLHRPLPVPARAIRAWVLARAAFIAARSPAAAELARHWGARGEVAIVPHCVPPWQAPTSRRDGVFTVGFAGRLVPEKGVRDLLRAVRSLEAPVRLILVGDGPLRDELAAADLPNGTLEIRSDFTHETMPEAYARMDVLVLPSRTTRRWAEQFGRVLVEALWCGVPVIGSSSGEIPWVIRETGGGILFPEGDDAALGQAIAGLRADPARRAALATTGREATERLFSTKASTLALDRLLLLCLGESSE